MAGIRVACPGLVAAFVLCASGAPVQAQTTLRYKFKEGEKLHYELEQKISTKLSLGGKENKVSMTQMIDLTWEVLSVAADGKARIKQRFSRFRFSMDDPPDNVEYDSEDGKLPAGPAGEILGPFFKALAGAEFTVTMSPRGEVTDVSVPDKLVKALQQMPAGGLGNLKEMFSKEGFALMARQSGLVCPQEALSRGDSWNQQQDVKLPFGTMEAKNVYTYEGSVTRGDRILEQFTIKPQVTFKPNPKGKVELKLKNLDSNKGIALFDSVAGHLVELTVTQETWMEINTARQDISQTTRQTVTLKLRDNER